MIFPRFCSSVFGTRRSGRSQHRPDSTGRLSDRPWGKPGWRTIAVSVLVGILWGQAPPLRAAETPQSPVDIPAETAARFGRLWVQAPMDRIQPIDAYSSKLLRKIYHRDHYGSLNATQMLLQWLCAPEFWQEAPLIYLKDRSLRDRFGDGDSHAAYNRFFDSTGNYLLGPEIEAVYSRSLSPRSRHDKEVLNADDKVNILMPLFETQRLALFPTDVNGIWESPGSIIPDFFPKEVIQATGLFPRLVEALRQGDTAEADSLIDRIARYQQAYADTFSLNESRKEAELFYTRADFFRTAFRGYLLLGAAFLLVFLLTRSGSTRRRRILTALSWGVLAVFLWQSAGMGCRWYISGRPPWTDAYESMIYVGWATVLGGLIFARRSPLTLMLATLMGGVILFVSHLSWLDPQITHLVPVLRSPWLMIHVSVITASYGFFGIGALCGAGILFGILRGHPNRELRLVGEISLTIGLALLTAGIFFGAIWANESWGRYWGWDPKETWALITMLFYAFTLHARFLPSFNNDYAFGALSVAGLYTVLMTFFGVNYLLAGLHSYGYGEGISPGWLLAIILPIAALILAAGLRYRHRQRTSEIG